MKKKILIVDDEPMMLMLTSRFLSADYDIIKANSGSEAIQLYEKEHPDMILSDLLMPEMSGFEMHKQLQEKFGEQIPVMFMTADESDEVEGKGFDVGAADFIRKPFQPPVLLKRIENIFKNLDRINDLKEEATVDRMTGFLNKAGVLEKLPPLCKTRSGVLMIIDLDSFKLVNDIYGHEMGDNVLRAFADIIRTCMRSDDIPGRIGGDEFVVFSRCGKDSGIIDSITERINEELTAAAKRLMGDDMTIPLGASVGAVYIPEHGTDYTELFKKADKALYYVKENGKHGFAVHKVASDGSETDLERTETLKSISKLFEERSVMGGAFRIGPEAFSQIYHYFMRYIQRYSRTAFKMLITLREDPSVQKQFPFSECVEVFAETVFKPLRRSDIVVQIRDNQFFMLLPDISAENLTRLIDRLLGQWGQSDHSKGITVEYETEEIMTLAEDQR